MAYLVQVWRNKRDTSRNTALRCDSLKEAQAAVNMAVDLLGFDYFERLKPMKGEAVFTISEGATLPAIVVSRA